MTESTTTDTLRAVDMLRLVRRFRCLGMDSLNRMIKYKDQEAEEARYEWRVRYNHEWPIYAVANGKEQAI